MQYRSQEIVGDLFENREVGSNRVSVAHTINALGVTRIRAEPQTITSSNILNERGIIP